MTLEAALAIANSWLDEVRGVHLVGSGRDDSGDYILVLVEGPIAGYQEILPSDIEGIRVVVEGADVVEAQAPDN